jgi:DNA primase
MNENYVINDDKINEIRSSVDIVDVISEYIPLTGKGKNFFGVCPFHNDHSPSMSVNRDRQIFKCFSCGAGGNVFTFVRDYENITFIEAVKKMADRAGIFLDIKTSSKKENPMLKKYYDIYDIAYKFYTNNINTKEGIEAKQYLEKRNINAEIIKEFGIGLSLKHADLLSGMLLKKGYQKEELLKSGIVTSKENQIQDIYYNRIMFPLYDLTGKVVGFSGRIYRSEDISKYINTKETDIFKKGELLYHYHKAKNIARKKDQIIVVEGFMDVIRLYTIGIENVVATMGTAVTKEQISLIKKMAKEIILMFDGDNAGKKAAYQTSTALNQAGVSAKIVVLEENLDPDEYILKYGKEKMEYKLSHPVNMMDFKLEYLKQDKDIYSTQDKAKYISEMIQELNQIDDVILKETTILKISEETGMDASFIKEQLKETTHEKKEKEKPKEMKIKKQNRYVEAEKRLIFYMLNNINVVKIYQKQVKFLNIEKYRLLAKEINYFYKEQGYVKEADIFTYLRDDEELLKTLEEITSLDLKEECSEEEIQDYVDAIQEYKLLNQIEYLKKEQKKAIDLEHKKQIGEEIVELKKQLVKEEI